MEIILLCYGIVVTIVIVYLAYQAWELIKSFIDHE